MGKKLVLFTSHFPFSGGETFLHHEFPALCEVFEEITLVPGIEPSPNEQISLPPNVKVFNSWQKKQLSLKKILLKYGGMILKWFVLEMVKSPHRKKYIKEFKWNWNRLMGLIMEAEMLPKSWRQKDVVLYSYWLNDWATILAILREKGWKNKMVCRAHGYDFDEGQQARGYHPFRYTEIACWDKIYQISQYGIDYMQQRHGTKIPVELNYLGVDVQEDNAPINQKETYTLVSCSHFYPVKRVQLIPEILRHLKVPFHWIHFGESIGMPEVLAKTAELLPEQKYEFRGWVDNKGLMDFYRTVPVDLFLNVSSLEGIPVAIMEAASFGIPSTGCRVCGIPEIVNEATGILFESDFDPQGAAQLVEQFLLSKSRTIQLRLKIQKDFERKFNAQENYKLFAQKLIA